jgi:ankyrin repeat protein
MDVAERAAFCDRTWGLHVASALQDAIEPRARAHTHTDLDAPDRTEIEISEVERLLACYRSAVDARDHDGTAALHSAALCGHSRAVELLLEHGASIDARSKLHETPLHLAAREGHVAVCELLVRRGADQQACTKVGATPLDLARRHQSREWPAVVALLSTSEHASEAELS